VAAVVFCGYSIPVYFQLLAHQPDRGPAHVTSFPPSYAFFVGGYLAMLAFVSVLLIFALIWVFFRRGHFRKTIQEDGTRII
jgi:uncharacterized membrane protein